MKTTKLLLLGAFVSLAMYSCSSDREEEMQPTSESKLDLKKIKTNNNSGEANKRENDTIRYNSPSSIYLENSIIPNESLEPSEGGDPKDVPPRK